MQLVSFEGPAKSGFVTGAIIKEDPGFDETLVYLLQASPSFSLRGGTREILRGIIARELGLR
jgi:hypothetical protein